MERGAAFDAERGEMRVIGEIAGGSLITQERPQNSPMIFAGFDLDCIGAFEQLINKLQCSRNGERRFEHSAVRHNADESYEHKPCETDGFMATHLGLKPLDRARVMLTVAVRGIDQHVDVGDDHDITRRAPASL